MSGWESNLGPQEKQPSAPTTVVYFNHFSDAVRTQKLVKIHKKPPETKVKVIE